MWRRKELKVLLKRHPMRPAAFSLLLVSLVGLLGGTRAVLSNDDALDIIEDLLTSSAATEGLTCSFNITGSLANATSLNATTTLQSAAIECTGGTLAFLGGPALSPHSASFKGVDYTRTYTLPGGTISIANQALTIVNSNFVNLNASAPASLILSDVNATLQTANFTGNSQASAGAIQAANNSNLAILNSTFSNNVGLSAGAIGITNSSLFVNGSTFENNSGQQGGAVYFMNGTDNELYLANSAFMNNRASTGGALYAQLCDQAVYYNNVFMNNSATGSGGSIFQIYCGGAMVLNAVTKGSATAGGGAYINAAGSIGLYQNEWTNNTATTGSGAVNFQTVQDGAIANDTYTGNQGQQGGAYFGTSSACAFSSCTFTANNASLNGGGIFRSGGSGGVNLCLFENNSASKLGGAIYDVQVAGGLTNNVFSGNKAGTSSSSAVYRLQSTNSVTNNQGLSTSTFQNNSPNSTTTSAAG